MRVFLGEKKENCLCPKHMACIYQRFFPDLAFQERAQGQSRALNGAWAFDLDLGSLFGPLFGARALYLGICLQGTCYTPLLCGCKIDIATCHPHPCPGPRRGGSGGAGKELLPSDSHTACREKNASWPLFPPASPALPANTRPSRLATRSPRLMHWLLPVLLDWL